MPAPRQPLSFAEVYDLYKRKKDLPVFQGMDLPQFANTINKATGTSLYSAGLHDSKVKRASLMVDSALESTGVPEVTGHAFRSLAEMITPQFADQAEDIGKGLPRMTLEFAGMALSKVPHPAALAVGIPLAGLGMVSAGAKAYTDTDSVTAGLIGAASIPGVMKAGDVGARFVASKLTRSLAAAGANTTARALEATGAALGQSAFSELAGQASSVAVSGSGYNPFTAENLFQHIASQAAFLPLTMRHVFTNPKTGARSLGEQLNMEAKAAADNARAVAIDAQKKFWSTLDRGAKAVPSGETPYLPGMSPAPKPTPKVEPAKVTVSIPGVTPTPTPTSTTPGAAPAAAPVGAGVKPTIPQGEFLFMGEPIAPKTPSTPRSEAALPLTEAVALPHRPVGEASRKSLAKLMGWKDDGGTEGGTPPPSEPPSGGTPPIAAPPKPGGVRVVSVEELRKKIAESGRPPGPPPEGELPEATRKALMDKATRLIEEGVATKSAAGTKEVGDVANALAEGPRVNDADNGKKMDAHLEDGKSATEAAQAVRQGVENAANEELARAKVDEAHQVEAERQAAAVASLPVDPAAPVGAEPKKVRGKGKATVKEAEKPEVKETSEAETLAEFGALPSEVQEFVGKAVVDVSQLTSKPGFAPEAAMHSDAASASIYQAALKWAKANGNTKLDKAGMSALRAQLTEAARRGILAARTKAAKRGVVHTDEQLVGDMNPDGTVPEVVPSEAELKAQHDTPHPDNVEVPPKEVPESVSPFMKEAVAGEEKSLMTRLKETLMELVSGERPITQGELRALGELDATPQLAAKLNAVVQDIAFVGTFGDVGSKSQKGFRFRPSPATLEAFGNVKAATVQKFVKENMGLLRKVMEARLNMAEGEARFATSDEVLQQVKVYFEDNAAMTPGSAEGLPVAVHRLLEAYYRSAGHTPVESSLFADASMRVAVAFKHIQHSRIGELVSYFAGGRSAWGVQVGYRGAMGQVLSSVLLDLKMKPGGSRAFDGFLKAAVLGHELWHGVWENSPAGTARQAKISALHMLVKGLGESDRIALLSSAFGVLIPKEELTPGAFKTLKAYIEYSVKSPEEFVATFAGLVALGAGQKSVKAWSVKELLEFSPKQQADFANGIYSDLREMMGAMLDLAKVAGVESGKAFEFYSAAHETVGLMLKSRQTITDAVARLTLLRAHDPVGWEQVANRNSAGRASVEAERITRQIISDMGVEGEIAAALTGLKEASPKVDDAIERHLGKQPNWFEKFLMIPAHLRELYPTLGDVEDVIFNFRGDASNSATRALTPFGNVDKVGHVSFDKNAPLIKVRGNKRLEEATSEILLAQQEAGKRLSPTDYDGLGLFPDLAPEEKKTVTTLVGQIAEAMDVMIDEILTTQRKSVGDTLASSLIHLGGLRSKEAMTRGGALSEAFFATMSADPVKAAEGKATVASLLQDVTPEVQQAVAKSFDSLHPFYDKLDKKLNSQRGWFAPEARLGKFYVRFRLKGSKRSSFIGLEDRAALKKRLVELEADSNVEPGTIKAYDKYMQDRDVNTLYSDIITVFGDLEKKAFYSALEEVAKVSPEAAETMSKLFHPTEAVFREVMMRGFGKHFGERSLVPGREEINMVQGVVAYIEGMTLGMSKSVTKRRSALLLADQDMKDNPQLKKLARDHVISVVDAPAGEWSTMKNLAFHYYLGSNISSLVIESFQPLFSLVPELTRRGTGWVGSFKRMGSALDALHKLNVNKPDADMARMRIAEALKEAENRQAIGLGVFTELDGMDADTTMANLRRASFSGADTLSPIDLAKKPVYWWGHLTKSMYRGRTAFNDRVAFLSGYMDGVERLKLPFEEAINYAIQVKNASMFSGGAAARPIEMFAGTGKLYGAVGALYSLRHYSVSMISNFYRMIHDSLGSSGLPPAELAAARKALGHMVGTQVVLSGVLGLPFASAALSIAEQIAPDLQVKKKLRETLAGLAGDDLEMGGFISDVALRGVTTGFTPLDLSARFGLGDAFGIDPNKGFSAATVFGVPGSLFERAATGVKEVAAGNPVEAARQFLPNAFSNIIKLHHDDYTMRDRNGNMLYDPDGSEVMLSAMGFRPKKLAQARESQMMMQRADEIAKRELTGFHDEAAKVLLQGRPDQVRQMLHERALADETYSVYAGIKAVVDSALDRQFPREYGRGGLLAGMTDREKIASLYPGRAVPLTETERVVKGAELSRTLGVAGVGQLSRTALRDAQAVDFLRQQNPALSRQHALLMLERLRGGGARRTSSISQLE